jgi:protein SCO1/2
MGLPFHPAVARPFQAVVLLLLALAPLHADIGKVPLGTQLPPQLKDVGITQLLNNQLPLDAVFTNHEGRQVRFGGLLGKRPAILVFVYYECPMLCHMTLNGLLRTLRPMTFNAGEDYDVIAVSFDPSETPQMAEKKRFEYLEKYNRPSAANGWHFLVGDDANIRRLTRAAGFTYSKDSNTGQWAHASGIMALTPDGRLARYFYGVEFSARDMRFGLVEASQGRIGTPVDQVLLYCFHYDAATGKYGFFIMNLLRALAILTVLAICGFWYGEYRRGRGKYNHVDKLPAIS